MTIRLGLGMEARSATGDGGILRLGRLRGELPQLGELRFDRCMPLGHRRAGSAAVSAGDRDGRYDGEQSDDRADQYHRSPKRLSPIEKACQHLAALLGLEE